MIIRIFEIWKSFKYLLVFDLCIHFGDGQLGAMESALSERSYCCATVVTFGYSWREDRMARKLKGEKTGIPFLQLYWKLLRSLWRSSKAAPMLPVCYNRHDFWYTWKLEVGMFQFFEKLVVRKYLKTIVHFIDISCTSIVKGVNLSQAIKQNSSLQLGSWDSYCNHLDCNQNDPRSYFGCAS